MLRLTRLVTPLHMVSLGAAALIGFYLFGLISFYGVDPGWLVDGTGHPRTNEYVGVRAAGELALMGRGADAYDWTLHRAQEVITTAHRVNNYFAWPYPPTYLFVAAILASLPFMASVFSWIGLTLALYAWSVSRIARLRAAGLWAIATPATLINAFVAHTGFWTAGVMGIGLDALAVRPLLAGVLFGLLTMKPQLGLLIPVALIAGGHWRAFGAAAATAVALALASIAVFGVEPWLQFWPQMARTSAHVRDGQVIMELLVTPYGFVRSLGLGDAPSLGVQVIASLGVTATVFRLWRSEAPMALKAAGLASASVLVTPYVFVYDLTHLSIAIAFLVRHTGPAGLTRLEITVMIAAMAMILALAVLPLPLGFVGSAQIAAIIVARAWPYLRPAGRVGAGTSVPT